MFKRWAPFSRHFADLEIPFVVSNHHLLFKRNHCFVFTVHQSPTCSDRWLWNRTPPNLNHVLAPISGKCNGLNAQCAIQWPRILNFTVKTPKNNYIHPDVTPFLSPKIHQWTPLSGQRVRANSKKLVHPCLSLCWRTWNHTPQSSLPLINSP